MATYVIGDIHGCLDQLHHLLDKLAYNKEDQIYFVGDLVNRGPKSLETLLFIKSLTNAKMILGNHDLHLLALAYKIISRPQPHPLDDILQSPHKIPIIEWLRHQPLMQEINPTIFMVHAGIPPQWDIKTAHQHANDVANIFKSDKITQLLELLYSDLNATWSDNLSIWKTRQYITLALTQMRKCTQQGHIFLQFNKNTFSENTLKPWFELYQHPEKIIFGHWAKINGESTNERCIATDTGCVWGGQLSAYHVETDTFIRTAGLPHSQKK